MWTMTQSERVVVVDALSRIPVLFPDELAKTGVSRLRVVDAENVPIGSDEVVFVPAKTVMDDGASHSLYYPMNPSGTTFYPVVCSYSDGHYSELFLTQDIDAGIAMLKSADVKFSITGGAVSDCWYMGLQFGAGWAVPGSGDWLQKYQTSNSTM